MGEMRNMEDPEITFPTMVPFGETGGVVCRPCYDRSITACGHVQAERDKHSSDAWEGATTGLPRKPAFTPPAANYPEGTPEYDAYKSELRIELEKFARGEKPYPYPPAPTPSDTGPQFKPGDRVYPRVVGGEVITVERVAVIEGSAGRQQFREVGGFAWRHSDEFVLAPSRPRAITTVTTLPTHGQTTIHVVPPRACGLGNCVGELHVQIRHDSLRLHINNDQRNALIRALGGTVPA